MLFMLLMVWLPESSIMPKPSSWQTVLLGMVLCTLSKSLRCVYKTFPLEGCGQAIQLLVSAAGAKDSV